MVTDEDLLSYFQEGM